MAEIGVGGDDGGAPACALALDGGAQIPVGGDQFLSVAEAFTVGRIGDDQPCRPARTQIVQLSALESHAVAEPRGLGIGAADGDGRRIPVAPFEARQAVDSNSPPGLRGGNQRVPERRIESPPGMKTEALAQQSGRDIARHQGCFDDQSAAAAHGVEQFTTGGRDLRPASAQQQCRGEIFLQGRRQLPRPIATPMQAGAGKIQTQRQPTAMQAGIDADIGVRHIHVWTRAIDGAEMIDDGILDALGTEHRVTNAAPGADKIHGDAGVGSKMRRPVHGAGSPVQLVTVVDLGLEQHQQYPVGQPRPQTGSVTQCHGARHRYPRHGLLHGLGAKFTELGRQQRLHTSGASHEPLSGVRHQMTNWLQEGIAFRLHMTD